MVNRLTVIGFSSMLALFLIPILAFQAGANSVDQYGLDDVSQCWLATYTSPDGFGVNQRTIELRFFNVSQGSWKTDCQIIEEFCRRQSPEFWTTEEGVECATYNIECRLPDWSCTWIESSSICECVITP